MKDTLGVKNPYRYRGYRYEKDTESQPGKGDGLYYLNSRYYNPEWGRFINADKIAAVTGDILSTNMFVYCLDNPINMHDNTGNRPDFDRENYEEEFKEWQKELYEQRNKDRLRPSDAIKREQKQWKAAKGKRGSKERDTASEESHKAKKR